MARIVVDSRCARTGYCVRIAPELFVLEDGLEHVSVRDVALDEERAPEEFDAALDAEATCPLSAITVVEDDGDDPST
jgi:ferredoxin